MGWHKPHNISGTIHCGDRIGDMCSLYRHLIGSNDVGAIGHYTGAVSIYGASPVVTFITTGFDVHEAYFYVQGERRQWPSFAERLEEELDFNNVPYSLVVHEKSATHSPTPE